LLSERPSGKGAATVEESVEIEALRMLLDRPEEIASRLHESLFSEGIARRAYVAASSGSLHDAIDEASPAVADLLTRLAVKESTAVPTDVLVGLAVRAAARVMDALRNEARLSPDPLEYAPTIQGLKLMSDDLLGDEPSMDALDRLLAWLSEHAVEFGC